MTNNMRAVLARLREVHEYEDTDALQECSGNGRNFYPEPGRLERYQAQHEARWLHLRTVEQSLLDEAEAIQRDNPGR